MFLDYVLYIAPNHYWGRWSRCKDLQQVQPFAILRSFGVQCQLLRPVVTFESSQSLHSVQVKGWIWVLAWSPFYFRVWFGKTSFFIGHLDSKGSPLFWRWCWLMKDILESPSRPHVNPRGQGTLPHHLVGKTWENGLVCCHFSGKRTPKGKAILLFDLI